MVKRVGEIMHERPVCLEQTASLAEVTKLIREEGYSHIPVTKDGKLVGTVSKTNLVDRFLRMLDQTSGKHYTKMLMEHVSVENMMHKNPITLKRGDDVEYAAELLMQGEFHGLIVVNDMEEVQGVVTPYDLLKSLYTVASP